MKRWRTFLIYTIFLYGSFEGNAQTLLLEPATNRLLIHENTREPRLDLIVRSFTRAELQEIAGYAVVDTVTKPTFAGTQPGKYQVRAGRMAEQMMLVVRNSERLSPGYFIEIDRQRPAKEMYQHDIASYLLNGESCLAGPELPFGKDTVRVALKAGNGELLSELLISYFYPKPEMLYVNVNAHPNANVADTTQLRRFLHHYNRAPTRYSKPTAVPDSLSIAETEMYFGFKKAYYDGKVRPTRLHYRIGAGQKKWFGTYKELSPFITLEQKVENFTWLTNGVYELQFSYSGGANFGTYPFSVDHHWFKSLAYYGQVLLLIPMALLAKPWLAALLLCGIIYLEFRKKWRKTRDQARKTNLELQAIQSQLNPHFVFNALSSLQGLINNNQIDRANTYLSGFSRLMRNTLHQSGKEMVPLAVEKGNIENYIRLEQLRFGFQYEITSDEQAENLQVEVPALLIQPIVENAIKHGISGSGENGVLSVSFRVEESDLIISVKDNGRGFDTSGRTAGKGLTLTRERIKLLNKQRYSIDMHILSGENGTLATLTFKKWL